MNSLNYFNQSADSIREFILQNEEQVDKIVKICLETLKENKIMICGNGGSAADSQHFAGEIVGTFYNKKRKGLPAIALSTDTSIITAVGNDLGFEYIFARQVEALGNPGDTLIVLSTSGNSQNCIEAVQNAKKKNITTIAFLGGSGGKLKGLCDHSIIAPSSDTPMIQQVHLCLYHRICVNIDQYFS